jgi:hypothetical protein
MEKDVRSLIPDQWAKGPLKDLRHSPIVRLSCGLFFSISSLAFPRRDRQKQTEPGLNDISTYTTLAIEYTCNFGIRCVAFDWLSSLDSLAAAGVHEGLLHKLKTKLNSEVWLISDVHQIVARPLNIPTLISCSQESQADFDSRIRPRIMALKAFILAATIATTARADPQTVLGSSGQFTTFQHPIRRVAVVGAGPSGLQAVVHLIAHNFTVRLFERAPDPGGNWLYSEEPPLREPYP